MAIDVLLVEDHLVRQSIRAALVLERGDEFNVTGEVDNGIEAIQFCRRTPPALVLMDVSMPGLNWIEATVEIVHHCPNTKVVVLSGYDDEVSVMNAITAGVRGYILKSASVLDALTGIRAVVRDGVYLSSQVCDLLSKPIQPQRPTPSELAFFC